MFKKLINKESITVIVHGGSFHADDVACVALLKLFHKGVKVLRKFKVDPESEDADYILDIGKTDIVSDSKVVLDHHQSVELIAGTEVKHCAFSKLVDRMTPEDTLFKRFLFKTLVLPISAQDNGQNGAELGLMPNPLSFVDSMFLSWKDDKKLSDQRFNEVAEMAMVVIRNIVKCINDKVEAITIVTAATEKAEDGIMTMDQFLPWVDTVVDHNAGLPKIQLVVFPNNRGEITVQIVPKKAGSFESWVKIPESIVAFKGCIGQAHGAFAFFDTMDNALDAAKQIVKNA